MSTQPNNYKGYTDFRRRFIQPLSRISKTSDSKLEKQLPIRAFLGIEMKSNPSKIKSKIFKVLNPEKQFLPAFHKLRQKEHLPFLQRYEMCMEAMKAKYILSVIEHDSEAFETYNDSIAALDAYILNTADSLTNVLIELMQMEPGELGQFVQGMKQEPLENDMTDLLENLVMLVEAGGQLGPRGKTVVKLLKEQFLELDESRQNELIERFPSLRNLKSKSNQIEFLSVLKTKISQFIRWITAEKKVPKMFVQKWQKSMTATIRNMGKFRAGLRTSPPFLLAIDKEVFEVKSFISGEDTDAIAASNFLEENGENIDYETYNGVGASNVLASFENDLEWDIEKLDALSQQMQREQMQQEIAESIGKQNKKWIAVMQYLAFFQLEDGPYGNISSLTEEAFKELNPEEAGKMPIFLYNSRPANIEVTTSKDPKGKITSVHCFVALEVTIKREGETDTKIPMRYEFDIVPSSFGGFEIQNFEVLRLRMEKTQ